MGGLLLCAVGVIACVTGVTVCMLEPDLVKCGNEVQNARDASAFMSEKWKAGEEVLTDVLPVVDGAK
eukprot:1144872-Pelagomonas_calceolata.AAC.4